MSGVEAAGFVLATFPLVLSALEHYQEGFEALKDWWGFRTEYMGFVHAIGFQSIRFDENLERLLADIIESDAEMNDLLKDPGGQSWSKPGLEDKLRDRLPKSYDWYMNTVNSMITDMEKLKNKLGVKDGETGWADNETSALSRVRWEYEFRRIKFTLSKKKREKLAKALDRHNEELRKLLQSSDELAPSRRYRKSPPTMSFQRAREHARDLHAVLTSGWRCSCQLSHGANLLLEKRTATDPGTDLGGTDLPYSAFKVLFCYEVNPAQPQPRPWDWHELEISVVEVDSDLPKTQSTFQPPPTAGFITNPKHDFRSQVVLTEVSESSRSSSLTSTTMSLAIKSNKKKVSFSQETCTVSMPQKGQPPNHKTPGMAEIVDLCSTIQEAQMGKPHLGFLSDSQNRRFTFAQVKESREVLDSWELVSLESLLLRHGNASGLSDTGERMALSRLERLAVAVTLASSLLLLHTTPWLSERWSKRDILFLRANEGSSGPVIFERPYVSRDATSTMTRDTPTHNSCRKSIQALGILLLELCFGQALEEQPIRKNYLGPDGKPNDNTDFATASKWYEQALGEGGPEYDNAIRRCIFCAFGPRSTNLEDHEFRDAVYSEVVRPLEKALRNFESI
ncbi:hypothetical protein FGG08_000557 [Glutinoglossum americanum]|uniref:DUF7580 domain-containing protein n=1 Tax=Glutinoglossum americanum TaxID=1670608 RepID=A0A9P8I3R2_9PEZI|nr:hypothetical protein FGG08_000557 [Glutinoglossum americanum]